MLTSADINKPALVRDDAGKWQPTGGRVAAIYSDYIVIKLPGGGQLGVRPERVRVIDPC